MPLSSAPRAAPHAALCCDSPNTVHSLQLAPEHNPHVAESLGGCSPDCAGQIPAAATLDSRIRVTSDQLDPDSDSRSVVLRRHSLVLLTVPAPARALPPQAREVAAWLLLRNQLLERAVEGGSVVDSRRSSRLSASNNSAASRRSSARTRVTPPGCGTQLWHSALALALRRSAQGANELHWDHWSAALHPTAGATRVNVSI